MGFSTSDSLGNSLTNQNWVLETLQQGGTNVATVPKDTSQAPIHIDQNRDSTKDPYH